MPVKNYDQPIFTPEYLEATKAELNNADLDRMLELNEAYGNATTFDERHGIFDEYLDVKERLARRNQPPQPEREPGFIRRAGQAVINTCVKAIPDRLLHP